MGYGYSNSYDTASLLCASGGILFLYFVIIAISIGFQVWMIVKIIKMARITGRSIAGSIVLVLLFGWIAFVIIANNCFEDSTSYKEICEKERAVSKQKEETLRKQIVFLTKENAKLKSELNEEE